MRSCWQCWLTGLALLPGLSGLAAAQQSTPTVEPRELIYCADRMSHEEREAYRAKMRAARTLEEKQALRAAHQAEMQARAAAQGGVPCVAGGRRWRGGAGR
ncbi:MAG: hypothetical protein HZC22_14345 [Rhodocyclales bacterium]|nr:hypothetical protein [Rhodocyclales bacterium]